MIGKFIPKYEKGADVEDLDKRLKTLENHLELPRDYEVNVTETARKRIYIRPDDKKTSQSFGREEIRILPRGKILSCCQSFVLEITYVPANEFADCARYTDNALELVIETKNSLETYVLGKLNPVLS